MTRLLDSAMPTAPAPTEGLTTLPITSPLDFRQRDVHGLRAIGDIPRRG